MSKRTRKPDLRPTIHRLYKVTLENSALYYLGRHSSKKDPDKDPYRGSGKWVTSIKDKSRLLIKTLEVYDTIKELKDAEEMYLFWYYDDPNNMNFNRSSCGAGSGTDNTFYGKTHTEESKAKNSAAHIGKTHTEESKAKISAAFSGENHPFYGKFGKLAPNFGNTHTEETKAKQSVAQSGENGTNVKLTDVKVKLIRELYATGDYTQRELASKFGVNQSNISDIINRKRWKHI